MKITEYVTFALNRLPERYIFTSADFVAEVNQKRSVILNVIKYRIQPLSKSSIVFPPGKNSLCYSMMCTNSGIKTKLHTIAEIIPGCFCLTGSEVHLPASVPLNIPRNP